MSNWFNVARENELSPGKPLEVVINDYDLLIVNLNNHYYAIQNLCSHDGGNLSQGIIEGDEIVCPRHGAHFCLKTGEATVPPAFEDIETFKTRVENGMVQVWLE